MQINHPDPDQLTLTFHRYTNERLAVKLNQYIPEHDYYEPYATLSCNIAEAPLELINSENEFAVKGYSENQGLDDITRYVGIFEDTGKVVRTGFVVCPIWRRL